MAQGLAIVQTNYLDVYPYERWNAKQIHDYEAVLEFEPSAINMVAGETSPPKPLTEADLIVLMDKFGM